MCRRKLTLEQHDEIREKLALGESQAAIAREYRVSKHMIWKIKTTIADGRTLWLYGYQQQQRRAARAEQRRRKKERVEPPEWDGTFGRCKHGWCKQPCIACWAARKATARDGHRFDDSDVEITLELERDAEQRRKVLRSQCH